MFKLGDKVQWTSSAGGFTKTKMGVVAEVVPDGGAPDRERFLSLYTQQGISYPRFGGESYVILVGKKPYWPRVSALRPATEA